MTDETALVELAPADWAIVGVYIAAMFGIAWWAMRQVKDCGGFLLAKRKMGKLMLIATGFVGGTNANHPMGVAAATFKGGLSGMWISLTWMLVTPFSWMLPAIGRRLRVVTPVDSINMRFGKLMGVIFKLSGVLFGPISMGLGIKSAAIVLEVMTGGAVRGHAAMLMITVPTVIYTVMGGVIAACATDVLQAVLIVILSFLLIPFSIVKAGGIAQLDAGIDSSLTSLLAAEGGNGFGPLWVFWFLVTCIVAAPLMALGGSSARSEMTARIAVFGTIIKRICTLGWGFTGLFAIALYSGHPALAQSSDHVFALASGDLLPVALRGLMVASILGAVMSSLDTGLVATCGIVTKNIYEEYFVRDASPKHYLFMTRVFAVFIAMAGYYWACSARGLIDYIMLVEPMTSLTGLALFVCLFWRRTTKWGAIASVAVMLPLFFIVQKTELINGLGSLPFGVRHMASALDALYQACGADVQVVAGARKYLPIEIMYPVYLIPGAVALVGVSLLTRQHNERDVAMFYARIDTPLGQEHKLVEQGFEVDDLAELDKDEIRVEARDSHNWGRLLIPDLLRLPRLLRSGEARLYDYRVDIIGFVVAVAFVVLFIAGVQWLGSLF